VRSQTPRTPPKPRRRPWLIALPLAVFVVLALVWTAFWFFAAHRADAEIARWRQREAQAGRIFACSDQDISGYPFRLEVRCTEPAAELRRWQPPVALAAKDALITLQVYDPTLVVGTFTSPFTIAEAGQPPHMVANWKLAQASLRARSSAAERLSIIIDDAQLAQNASGPVTSVAAAEHIELHGRLVSGSPNDNPVIELGLRLTKATVPLQPVLAQPTDGVMSATVYGLKDFNSRPWREQLREMSLNQGRIEIQEAKFTQGDIVAIGTGALAIKPTGRLDGQVRLTVASLEKLIALLGIDQEVTKYLAQRTGAQSVDKLVSGLDRLMPGLGGAIRGPAGASLAAAGISMLGEPAQLDGRRAVALPLRFVDGAVFLGPIAIPGQMPPLF
jgi:hypothetical protein